MIKRPLTILTLITLTVLSLGSLLFKNSSPHALKSPTLKEEFLNPSLWKITSSEPLESLKLESKTPLPSHHVLFQTPYEYWISFDEVKWGWFGYVELEVFSRPVVFKKKVFLGLENPKPASFWIKNFAPTPSRRWGDPSVEIEISASGNLSGVFLQIELPQDYLISHALPKLDVYKGETWEVIFSQVSALKPKELSVDLLRKKIYVPLKLSPTAGIIAFLRSPQNEIIDLLIYRRKDKPVTRADGWGTQGFKNRAQRLSTLDGYSYSKKLEVSQVIDTKPAGAARRITRGDKNLPFDQANAGFESREPNK
jgi:hypothetical protein